MSGINITSFSAMQPAKADKLLERTQAAYSVNVRTYDGTLQAMPQKSVVSACSEFVVENDTVECRPECSVKTIGCDYDDLITIKNGRLTHSDGIAVGMMRPELAPTVAASSGTEKVTFRYSTINVWNEESPKSLPSELGFVSAGGQVKITTPTAGEAIRVYCAYTSALDANKPLDGGGNTAWHMVGDFTSPALFDFNLAEWALTSESGYDSDNWCDPFDVDCIQRTSDNYYVVHKGKDIWISERGQPHAYPLANMSTLDDDILKVIIYYDKIFVLTNNGAYLGRYPAMQDGSLDVSFVKYCDALPYYGGGTKTSFGCMFSTHKELIALTPSVPDGVKKMTNAIVNEQEWGQKYKPTVGKWCNGVYYGSGKTPFLLDVPDNNFGGHELNTFTETDISSGYMVCGNNGSLYHSANGSVFREDSVSYRKAVWHSKVFRETGYRVFTAIKVVGENLGGVKLTLWNDQYGDYETIELQDSDTNRPIRIRRVRGMDYQFKIELPSKKDRIIVKEIHLAPSINDMSRT